MTTLAYKNGFLAADRLVTPDRGLCTKIGRNPNGDIAGICGSLALGQKWMRAFVSDADELPSLVSVNGKDEHGYALIIRKSTGAVEFMEPDGLVHFEAPFYAYGSGSHYALAAMEAGASAKRAVEIAAKYDPTTGPDVEVLRL